MNTETGLEVYNIQDDAVEFTAFIDVTIDEVQYWRDRPLYLKTIKPLINTIVDSVENPQDYLLEEDLSKYVNHAFDIKEQQELYNQEVLDILKEMENYSYISDNEDLDIDYPDPGEDNLGIQIKDDDGNVLTTITTDLNQREKNSQEGVEIPVTLLYGIPPDASDDDRPTQPDQTTIISLPDSYIRDKLYVVGDMSEDFIQQVENSSHNYNTWLKDSTEAIVDNDNIPPGDIMDTVLQDDIEMWYGIPLIAFSSKDTEIEDSYILHIDTKHGWTIHLLNFVSGFTSEELRIDKQLPPGKRFIAGIYKKRNELTLMLKIDGDPELYEKTLPFNGELDLKLHSYGADQKNIKRMCGLIWDYYYFNGQLPYTPRTRGEYPYIPNEPGTHGYGGETERVIGEYVYQRRNWRNPARNGGDFLDLGRHKFVYNGYLENFFCREELVGLDFSIMWYQYQIGYPNTMVTLLSDDIHNNYIRYDYSKFEIVIDFNDKHYREHITLPEFMWFQVVCRLRVDTGELIFSFIDFFDDEYTEVSVNVGPDAKFELVSLWGRWNKANGGYDEVGKGVFGLVIVQEKFISNYDIYDMYLNHKTFLQEYDIKNMLLPQVIEER